MSKKKDASPGAAEVQELQTRESGALFTKGQLVNSSSFTTSERDLLMAILPEKGRVTKAYAREQIESFGKRVVK